MSRESPSKGPHSAGNIRSRFGERLVGMRLETEPMGDWAGGLCEVVALGSDPSAPEIVFDVMRVSDGALMGVFEHEIVWKV